MSNNYWEDEEDDFDSSEAGDGSDLVKKLRNESKSSQSSLMVS
jgi:hypothetical protein